MTTSQAEKDRKKERDGGGGPKRGDPVSSPEIKRPGKVGKQVSALSFSLLFWPLFLQKRGGGGRGGGGGDRLSHLIRSSLSRSGEAPFRTKDSS